MLVLKLVSNYPGGMWRDVLKTLPIRPTFMPIILDCHPFIEKLKRPFFKKKIKIWTPFDSYIN